MFIKFLEKTTFARHQQIFILPLPYLAVWKAKEGVSVYHRPHSLLVSIKVPFFLEDYLFLNDYEMQPLDSFLNGSLFGGGQSVNNINDKQRMAQLLENVTRCF